MSQKPPAEITLEFADGDYLFRLPLRLLAELQQLRGTPVTWPDGSSGVRPKAFGTIWREQMTGEYDPLDCRQIVRLALIGGNRGVVAATETEIPVSAATAERLLATYFDPWPEEDKWDLARAVLAAVGQGYAPPKGDGEGEDEDPGNVQGAGMTGSSTSPEFSETP